MINYLIDYLIKESGRNIDYKNEDVDLFRLFRALVNLRNNELPSKEFLEVQDKYLNELLIKKGILEYKDNHIKDNIYLVQGDITTLNVDCIVNAANSQMLGCFIPNHGCIDNAIHTYSGVQLRDECRKLMNGKEEPNGQALITNSYNLACKKIIHTVGPIVYGSVTNQNKIDLRNCYINCIEAAIKNNMKSIAICCISTGEFCYPNYDAAIIALDVIKDYKQIDIIINVFKDVDYEIYRRLLKD
ncbi:MAG: macro domain-containing protein [bacterium]